MDTAEENRAAVRERLEQLHASYEGFDVFGETATVDAERYGRHREALATEGVGLVAVWAGREERGLLLTRDGRGVDDVWTVPSVSAHDKESLDDAATRCVRERAGLECSIGDVYRVERVELRKRGPGESPPLHELTVHFDAVVAAGEPTPGTGVSAAAFHATPPEAVDRTVAKRMADDDPTTTPELTGTV
jgi:ADP-ribose pyrophosphatase YjhB (NUDIX family)